LNCEAELGVVIGICARDLAPGTGMSAVAGWTIVNDVTAKILPRPKFEAETVVFPLKGRDAFAPVGDVLVTRGEVADPASLELVTRVNGEERQRFSPADMVHDVASVVEYLSGLVTLEPGDLIATGTSVGIGIIQDPLALLADGDVVECELAGYSRTRNEIV
jgi:acylpyruvate hydrolase